MFILTNFARNCYSGHCSKLNYNTKLLAHTSSQKKRVRFGIRVFAFTNSACVSSLREVVKNIIPILNFILRFILGKNFTLQELVSKERQ